MTGNFVPICTAGDTNQKKCQEQSVALSTDAPFHISNSAAEYLVRQHGRELLVKASVLGVVVLFIDLFEMGFIFDDGNII